MRSSPVLTGISRSETGQGRKNRGSADLERTDKETIRYIHEPTDLQCGQAVLAMLTGMTAEAVCTELGNERETTLREMKDDLV